MIWAALVVNCCYCLTRGWWFGLISSRLCCGLLFIWVYLGLVVAPVCGCLLVTLVGLRLFSLGSYFAV